MTDAFGGQLTFPVLTVPDLIEGFRLDLGSEFDIKENDFTQPSKERWVRLYCFLLAHMTDNDADDLMNQLRSVGHEHLDYAELYVESQLLMNLAKFMAQMLLQCKITDFTIEDITRPTKKRLTHVLSGIMNYIRFRANRKDEFGNIIQKMASKVEQKEALRKENEELVKKIDAIRKQRTEESEAAAKVLGEVEVSGARLDQLRKNNGVLKKAVDDVKLQIGKKQLDMQRRQERASRVLAEIRKVEEQIVTSPERFDVEIREHENRLDRMEKLQLERNAHLDKLKKLRNPELKAECRQALKEISAELEKEKARQQMTYELANVRSRVHDLQEGAGTLQKVIQKQKLVIANKQEKLEKLEVVHRHEEEAAELELQKLMKVEDKKKDLADELEIIQSQRQSIRLEAAEVTTEHEENMGYLREEYASLLTSFEAYNQNVASAMGNAIPDELKDFMKDNIKA